MRETEAGRLGRPSDASCSRTAVSLLRQLQSPQPTEWAWDSACYLAALLELAKGPRASDGSRDRHCPIDLSAAVLLHLYSALTCGSLNLEPDDVPSNVKLIACRAACIGWRRLPSQMPQRIH